jgi:hypothetical protein
MLMPLSMAVFIAGSLATIGSTFCCVKACSDRSFGRDEVGFGHGID